MIGQPHKSPSISPKVLWPVLVVIVLGILVGGFFWLNSYIYNEKQGDGGRESVNNTSTTEVDLSSYMSSNVDMENWSTYQNTLYGFSFEYPADWQWNPDLAAPTIQTKSIVILESHPFDKMLELSVTSPYDCLGIQECAEYDSRVSAAHSDTTTDLKQIEVADKEAMWEVIENTAHPDTKRAKVYLINGAYMYKFTFRYEAEQDQLPIFAAILSSMRFDEALKNNQFNVDTSGWLTYRNDEYGYTLNYPDSWSYEVIFNNDDSLNRPTPLRLVRFYSPGHKYSLAISIKKADDVGSGLYWSPAYDVVMGEDISIMGREITVEESIEDGLIKDFAVPGVAEEAVILGYEFSASFRADTATNNTRSEYIDISDKVETEIAREILSSLSL
ncbi:hypothetical protein ACFL0L_00260 [Patescibacteria group bacterium]